MEQSEIEMLVSELETRLDRLRSLYDQYFMGIEKLEPLVPRKDVERRMHDLRKMQIKNTGSRFRFQSLVARYNTFISHWMRISRQIEEGTYKRDVMRATKRFGLDPVHERPIASGGAGADATAASARSPARAEGDAQASVHVVEIPDEPIEEVYELDASSIEIDASSMGFEEVDPFAALGKPARTAVEAPKIRERFASAPRFDVDDGGVPFEEADPFPKPREAPGSRIRIEKRAPDARDTEPRMPVASVAPGTPSIRPLLRPATGAAFAPLSAGMPSRPPSTRQGLGTDTEPRIPVAKPGSEPPTTRTAPPSVRRPATLPSVPSIAMSSAPGPRASVPVSGGPGGTPSGAPLVRTALPSSPGDDARRPATLPSAGGPLVRPSIAPADGQLRRPGTLPSAISPPGRSLVVPPPSAPAVTQAPPPTMASAAPPAPRIAPMPSAPPRSPPSGPSIQRPPTPAPVAVRPAISRPAPAPPAASAPPPPKPAPAASIGDLSNDRFGQIYSQYVETRRKQNEPTHAITREALAKQLGDSTKRVKEKHAGRAVDFEVVVKDGKTILRPVVK